MQAISIGNVRVPALRLALVSICLVLGCGTGAPFAPRNVGRLVEMNLALSSTSGSPGSPITMRGTVRNTSPVSIWYQTGCYGFSPVVNVWEPDRHNVQETCGNCPNAPCAACAGILAELRPGESLSYERTFEGKMMTCSGPYDATPGNYAAELSFSGRLASPAAVPFTAVRSTTIHWSTP